MDQALRGGGARCEPSGRLVSDRAIDGHRFTGSEGADHFFLLCCHMVGSVCWLQAHIGLPYSQLREMRSFFISRGLDIFPSEHKHRAAAGELATEYETGFVALPGGKRAHFIRMADVWGTIRRIAIARHQTGELSFWPTQPRDRLKLHVSMDKGGKYTKLMLTWLSVSAGNN